MLRRRRTISISVFAGLACCAVIFSVRRNEPNTNRPILVYPNAQNVFAGHSDGVFGLCFSPNGNVLYSAGGSGETFIWELQTATCTSCLKGPSSNRWGDFLNGARAVAISHDNSMVATGHHQHQIRVWKAKHTEEEFALFGDTSEGWEGVRALAFSNDDKKLASLSYGGVCLVWDLAGHTSLLFPNPNAYKPNSIVFGEEPETLLLFLEDIGPQSRPGSSRFVESWNLQTNELKRITSTSSTHLNFSTNGRYAVTWGYGPCEVYDIGKQKLIALINPVTSVDLASVSPNGMFVAIAEEGSHRSDVSIFVYQLREQGQRVARAIIPEGQYIRALTFSDDSSLLAAGTRSGKPLVLVYPTKGLFE